MKYRRQWAVRCMHEASCHDENSVVTLTYDEENVPSDGSLDRQAWPLFMRRLRKAAAPREVRYFHAGEYGERNGRPHYHGLLFGWSPGDREMVARREGRAVFRSRQLEALWPYGLCHLEDVSWAAAAYVAGYVSKKARGREARLFNVVEETGELVAIVKEYKTMSRRPGIGARWYDRFRSEVYANDSVVFEGALMAPPRYYDEREARRDAEAFELVRAERLAKRAARFEDDGPRRREAREVIAAQTLGRLERSL